LWLAFWYGGRCKGSNHRTASSASTEMTAPLLLEIDKRHCENQDRGPANIKLFFFSIEHSQHSSGSTHPTLTPRLSQSPQTKDSGGLGVNLDVRFKEVVHDAFDLLFRCR
jgi:hypothetical protein